MITIRKSQERGLSQLDWLDSLHTFSFADYHDPEFMGFSHLRVINEDWIKPNKGFDKHPHRNMEIITYVVEGTLQHQDSLGNGSIIKPGEIQRMSAGSGVRHSEFNYSNNETLHLLQIWILPNVFGLQPSYEQKPIIKKENKLLLIGSNNPQGNVVKVHQNLDLFVCYLQESNAVSYTFNPKNSGWLQLIKGKIKINNHELKFGDGASITNEQAQAITITCIENAEFLFFVFK